MGAIIVDHPRLALRLAATLRAGRLWEQGVQAPSVEMTVILPALPMALEAALTTSAIRR